jgi:mannose-1-phosphate guanylyltransferase
MLHVLIMAGGAGTRFWPASRAARPKQLLRLAGPRSMIQMTLDRLGDLVPPERVLVVTSRALVGAIAEQLPELPAGAIVGEPCKRDTAPCIGLAAFMMRHIDPEATMLVLPADHLICTPEAFRQAVRQAVQLVDEAADEAPRRRIVTFGIRPTYPSESFGYIERGELLAGPQAAGGQGAGGQGQGSAVYRVVRFREKPKAELAREFLSSGRFYWNSGIFVWRAGTILEALAEHQGEMFARLKTIAAAWGTAEYGAILEREFAAIRGISIDFAVMEHAREVVVIEAPFTWDDVGSWQALARLHPPGAEGNTVMAKHLGLNTSGCTIRGEEGHLIVTLGLRDTLIVQTPDCTLVANKHDEEAIRQVVKLLEERGWAEYL